jgi:hypothetical protein
MMVTKESFLEVYRQRTYQLAAIIGAAGMAVLLVWSSQIVTVFPQGGIFLDVDALTLVSIALAAALMGITLPLHWYAWRRTRVVAPASGMGLVGTLFSIGSLSCCAPLLLPGVLSLVGFSGSSLLALNLRLHQLRLPLTALALAFLLVSLWIGLKNVTRSCRIAA